jgi:hypothetical protein
VDAGRRGSFAGAAGAVVDLRAAEAAAVERGFIVVVIVDVIVDVDVVVDGDGDGDDPK